MELSPLHLRTPLTGAGIDGSARENLEQIQHPSSKAQSRHTERVPYTQSNQAPMQTTLNSQSWFEMKGCVQFPMNQFASQKPHSPMLENISAFLSSTISEISQSICDVGFTGESMHRDPFTAGMATTLTAAVLFNQNIYIRHEFTS